MINFFGNYNKEKLSNYNVVIENKDGYVFYNQISGSLILFGQKEFEDYRKLLKNNFFVDHGFLQTLRENKFIIPDSFDELEFMEKKYNEIKRRSTYKLLTIVPTDKCNLGCFYCYEDKSQWKNMSYEVIQQTKKFVKEFIESSPTNLLKVTWFGGEPTLNLSCIEELSLYFKEICDENKIKYDQYMVTNGTNMNEKVVERLIKIGLKECQVTIDGFQEDHDKSRPYLSDLTIDEMSDVQIEQRRKINPNFGKFLNIIDQPKIIKNKKSSYNEIINNLKIMYAKGFFVSLRCNIGSHNIENHQKLLDHLEQLGLTKPNLIGGVVAPYVAQIFNHEKNSSLRDLTREKFSEFETNLKSKYCGTTAATSNLSSFSGDSCTANKQYSFCISQSGKLTKCWHHVSNEKYVVGDVFNTELARVGVADNFSPFDDSECVSCSVLPTCLGGCKEGNKYYEKQYDEEKYHGCSTLRWNIRSRVNNLYESKKNA